MAWVWSDRGLLVIGTSLVLGGLGYIWADCARLWRVRRKIWDVVDLGATTVFTALILGSALAMGTYDSLPAVTVGGAAAVLSYAGVRRVLRTHQRA